MTPEDREWIASITPDHIIKGLTEEEGLTEDEAYEAVGLFVATHVDDIVTFWDWRNKTDDELGGIIRTNSESRYRRAKSLAAVAQEELDRRHAQSGIPSPHPLT